MTTNNTSKWVVDPGHSQVQFKVKHLGIANVAGTFKLFNGDIETDNDDFNQAKVQCAINADSIYTNHEQRDNDLKSPAFFDTQSFPEIKFSGVLEKKNEDYELAGELTIRQITKHIVMQAEFTGLGKGRFNDTRAGFEASGKINRKDFGLVFNMLTETGNFVIGEEIKLHFDVELIRQ